MTEEQFRALELWVLAAANRSTMQWPFGDGGAYEKRRDEAKALLVDSGSEQADGGAG